MGKQRYYTCYLAITFSIQVIQSNFTFHHDVNLNAWNQKFEFLYCNMYNYNVIDFLESEYDFLLIIIYNIILFYYWMLQPFWCVSSMNLICTWFIINKQCIEVLHYIGIPAYPVHIYIPRISKFKIEHKIIIEWLL